MDKGTFVVSDINSEIPIAPPSINELGSKNPFNPKPAETIPISIKRVSLAIRAILVLKISTSINSYLKKSIHQNYKIIF